jgi:hypothetical protein
MSELVQVAADRLGLEGPFVGPPTRHRSCLGTLVGARAGLVVADNGWSLVVVECAVPALPLGIRLGKGVAQSSQHPRFDRAHAIFARAQFLAALPPLPPALLDFVADCEPLGGIELAREELRTWQALAVTPADLVQLWRNAERAVALGRERGIISL